MAGRNICDKHDEIYNLADNIMDIVAKAKEDGQRMESALFEKNREIDRLRQEVVDLENRVSDLLYEIDHPINKDM